MILKFGSPLFQVHFINYMESLDYNIDFHLLNNILKLQNVI